MIQQIGFYCPHISNIPQHSTITQVLNGLTDQADNTIMFNTIYQQTDNNRKFCLLPSVNARYFYGILFCFDPDSLSVISQFPGPSHKVFIASDIIWQNKHTPTTLWQNLLESNVHIVTLDQKNYDLYKMCFKEPISNMVEGFSLEGCKNVIQKL
jgi:hypothetical protein